MDKDILAEAKDAFAECEEAESDNRRAALDDLRFARLADQWPANIKKQRELDGRPCLTINRLPSFIRQVVNDVRQNKPSIKVHPADSNADIATADIYNGLIRNIEYTSSADVAYDTAADFACSMGFGYLRVVDDYTCDDSFDRDMKIKRVSNPFTIYGDPSSQEADSSDWNISFVTEMMDEDKFIRAYPKAEKADWNADRDDKDALWRQEGQIRVAEYWLREKVAKNLLLLSDGQALYEEAFLKPDPESGISLRDIAAASGIQIVRTRPTESYKVTQHILTGAEVLSTTEWLGKYIPIIPVYGEELNIEGKRHFLSLIRQAKDAQQMLNYWRPLALDTPIPTPMGWSTMGDLEIGDQVFDETGTPCNVVGKSPVHINRPCFDICFDDGSVITSDAEHPWLVEERVKRVTDGIEWKARKLTTREIVPGKHFIVCAKPIDLPHADLPVHPYVLGYWLGDGATASGSFCCEEDSIEELLGHFKDLGYDHGQITRCADRIPAFTLLGLAPKLRELGVIGNKSIPKQYLRSSEAQRWALLQGLMDSDGCVNKTLKNCTFTNTSPAIAAGFKELLASLGIKASYVIRKGRGSKMINSTTIFKDAWQFSFTPLSGEPVFRLRRKAITLVTKGDHWRRTKRHRIKSVTSTASVPVQCIAVDSPSHLFLAGESMIPTHNTVATELVALAPKAPYIGEEGAFSKDPNWMTANTASHPYLEYKKGSQPPIRQPFDGVPAGALQEALNASDDMKSIMGLFDASLGARSNETSGRAIMARQREGDISTFHFIDNMARAIRHTGRVLIDLIPHVYSSERIIRVMGEDSKPQNVQINKEFQDPQTQQPRIYNLTSGKYDLTVTSGPSFTTRREEAAAQMIELIRSYPDAAPVIGDLLAKNLDWPQADEIAKRLESINPAMQPPQDPMQNPEMQIGMAKLEMDKQKAALDTQTQLARMEADKQKAIQDMQIKQEQMALKRQEAEFEAALNLQKHQAEMDAMTQKHQMDMQHGQQKAMQNLHGETINAMTPGEQEEGTPPHPLIALVNTIAEGNAATQAAIAQTNAQTQQAVMEMAQAVTKLAEAQIVSAQAQLAPKETVMTTSQGKQIRAVTTLQ